MFGEDSLFRDVVHIEGSVAMSIGVEILDVGIDLKRAFIRRDMEVFGSSGARGVVNEMMTPQFALGLAAAVGTVSDSDSFVVARDTRTSGEMLGAAVMSGLMSCGKTVHDIGIVPTPGVQCYCAQEEMAGVIITASHNPPAYNGIKLVDDAGVELRIEQLESIEQVFECESFAFAGWRDVGTVERVDGARDAYMDEVVQALPADRIRESELTVAVDPGNGAGSLTSPRIFRELGCRVVTINSQPDGRFPGRDPEPVRENLTDLCSFVKAEGADLGIAHDGDADRAVFVDEQGEWIDGDTVLAVLAAAVVEDDSIVVSGVNVSQRLVDVVTEAGGSVELTRVGSTFILNRLRELMAAGERVPIAGEGNGGIIFPEYRLGRDGAFVAGRFLDLIRETPASEVTAPFDTYFTERVNIPVDSARDEENKLSAVGRVAERESVGSVSRVDGFRFEYDDGWVLVRPSGTEPLIRIYAEARSQSRAQALAGRFEDVLDDAS